MKKRILPVFLILIVLLSAPAFAVGGRLTAPPVSGKVGEQVHISVRLDNPGIVATRIFVRYDSKVLTLDKAENGEVFSAGQGVFGRDLSANPYTMLWDDSLNPSDNTKSGTLCTLTFTVKAGTPAGTANVHIAVDKASTFDTNLNEVSVADCTCNVGVPTATTKTQTTAKPAVPVQTAAGTTAASGTTTTVKASAPTVKTSPATTVKTAAPSEKLTAPQGKTTTAAPVPAVGTASGTTVPESGKKETVPASAVSTPATDEVPQPEPMPQEETVWASATQPDTQPESTAALRTAEPAPQKNLKPLWGLSAIPVAAIALIVLRRKKNNTSN